MSLASKSITGTFKKYITLAERSKECMTFCGVYIAFANDRHLLEL